MNQPIRIWPISTLPDLAHEALLRSIHGDETVDRIAAHNRRTELLCMRNRSSNAKPFTPSTVPASPVVESRVIVTAEHGGSFKEARS